MLLAISCQGPQTSCDLGGGLGGGTVTLIEGQPRGTPHLGADRWQINVQPSCVTRLALYLLPADALLCCVLVTGSLAAVYCADTMRINSFLSVTALAPLLLVPLLLALASPSFESFLLPQRLTDLYVDQLTGSDSHSGNTTQPLRTLQAALVRLRQRGTHRDDGVTTVHLRPGRHMQTQPLVLDGGCANVVFTTWGAKATTAPGAASAPGGWPWGGRHNQPIGEEQQQAVISGGLSVPATAWVQHPNDRGLWTAAVPALGSAAPQQLFVGGERRQRARHPNLFADDGTTVLDFPYLYWAKPLCLPISHRGPAGHCEQLVGCDAVLGMLCACGFHCCLPAGRHSP